jgi:transposase
MRKIKDVLRLKLDAQMSHQQIAAALGISKGVVTTCWPGRRRWPGLDDGASPGRGRTGAAPASRS